MASSSRPTSFSSSFGSLSLDTSSALVPASQTERDRTDRELKTNTVYDSALSAVSRPIQAVSHSVPTDVGRAINIAQFSLEDLLRIRSLIDLEISRRGQGNMLGTVENSQIESRDKEKILSFANKFKDALSNKQWRDLVKIQAEIERECPDLMAQILTSASIQFTRAFSQGCISNGRLDGDAFNAIYNIIAGTPVLADAGNALVAEHASKDDYSRRPFRDALFLLLLKDRTQDNEQMIEVRSNVLRSELSQKHDLNDWITSGPIFFLSDDSEKIKARWYKDAREAFIAYFQKSRGYQTYQMLNSTPHRLPPDADRIFTEEMAKDTQTCASVLSHIENCSASPLKDTLVNRFKQKSLW